MAKLYAATPLEDSFGCNFNVLIAGVPQVLGVRALLEEWTAFRMECVRRRVWFDLEKAREKLHLLRGLQKILLDIDKAVRIVRETEEEAEVVPNLMIGFGIDETQAEYVAEIKLRHLNREYILKRLDEVEKLEQLVEDLDATIKSKSRIKSIIIDELKAVAKKYGQPRKTTLLYATDLHEEAQAEADLVPDYPCTLFFTAEGYFKKITPQSLRMSGEHRLKEGDRIVQTVETTNKVELLFFGDAGSVYKSKAADFADTKASVLGDYVGSKLGFDDGEKPISMVLTEKYTGYMVFFFENGKVAKVDMASYATKTNRRKLIAAYSLKSPLVAMFHIEEDCEFLLISTAGRRLVVHTGAVAAKTTRDTQGVQAMTLKAQHRLSEVKVFDPASVVKAGRYRTKSLPAAGALPAAEDIGEQMTLL